MALPIGTTKRAVTTIWRSSLDSRPARLTIIKRATRAWRATPKPSRLLPRRQPLPNHLKSLWLAIWAEPSLSPATSSLRSRATQSPMRTIFLWFLGDIGYADDSFIHSGAYVQFDYEIAYNEFMEQIEPFAAIKPVMVLPGNHEAECHSPNCQLSSTKVHQLSNFSAYVHRFRMPYDESGATSNMWYSFDVPPIHFVNIDTETDYKNAPNDSYTPFTSNGNFANGGSWTEWLEADLDKVDRSHTPFVFGEAGDVQPQRPDACATCDQWPTTLPFPPISLRISRRPPPDLLGDLLRQQRQPRRRLRQPAGRDRGYYVFA
mmetsp:Transcript_86927/g.246322  ORF Transcript_86927/g.246322 Transcript_86927/m.246322 type:complete len:318 (-) Transcript_86927:623-1576(-)